MMSLFIDTSNYKLILGIIDEQINKVLVYYNEVLKEDLSSKILVLIKKCIDEIKITSHEIDKIYIVNGPGSFTGVRIGVTIAKTYAWALNIKVIPISSLEVLASTKSNTEYVVPMIDARREAVYAGIYDKNLKLIFKDSYIRLSDLKEVLPSNYTFISDDKFENYEVVSPKVDILKVINNHKNDLGVNPHELVPNYLKITEAEANLNKQ